MIIFILWNIACAPASAQSPPKTLIVILLPNTSYTAWQTAAAPNLHRILASGALAVMNTRTARLPSDHVRESPESAVLTLGAGSRAIGGPELMNFTPGSTADPQTRIALNSLYARLMGRAAPRGRWVNAEWPRVMRENQQVGYDLRPGNLGDALAAHGIVIESDGGPLAFPLACTSDGTVRVSPAPLPTLQGCLILDAGSDVHKADALIDKAAAIITARHGRLIILSPSVNDQDYAQGRRLAPVVVWGFDIAPGLLFSPSTQRAGLVANTDFALTVTSYFGATDTNSWLPTMPFGRPWSVKHTLNAQRTITQIEQGAYAQADALHILPAVAIVLGIFVFAGSVLMLRGQFYPWLAILPVLIIDALSISGSFTAFLVWLSGMALVAVFLRDRLRPSTILAVSAVSLVVTLSLDMVIGDPLMRYSLLGYSAVEGARYYGMGNEAMGALVGGALVGAVWLAALGKNGLIAALTAMVCIALLLGSPMAGAKAGGLLVAIAGFGSFLWTITGRIWTRKTSILLITAMVVALAFASVGDLMHQGSQQTHMGQAVGRIRGGGWQEALDIITRKLAVEARLLSHSAWACPLWASVFGLLAWKRKQEYGVQRNAGALLTGGGASMITCLAVNDAGVVAAALCGVFVWSGLSMLKRQKSPHQREAKNILS